MKKIKIILLLSLFTNISLADDEGKKLHSQASSLFNQGKVKEAIEVFENACELNYYRSCYTLGYFYVKGKILEQNYKKAKTLYEKGCNAGDADGCYELGVMYHKGDGVKQDNKTAEKFYKIACDKEIAHACSNLGNIYYKAENYSEAKKLYEKACDKESINGCHNLGLIYSFAKGVEKDDKKAEFFFNRACSKTDLPHTACFDESVIHFETVPENDPSFYFAAGLFRQACEEFNSARGCYNLGVRYQTAKGVEKDLNKAKNYFNKGCELGYKESCKVY